MGAILSGIYTVKRSDRRYFQILINQFKMALQQLKLSNSFRSLSISPGMYGRFSVEGIPKRPPTPWVSYVPKCYPSVKIKFPELDGPGLFKVISSEWAKVPDAQKSKFQTLYLKEKNNYNSQMAQ